MTAREHLPGCSSARNSSLRRARWAVPLLSLLALLALTGCTVAAQPGDGARPPGGEANLRLPDLSLATFFGGAVDGRTLLLFGVLMSLVGLGFGLWSFLGLSRLPVHAAMREVSELIYSTCRAYLTQQGRFLMILWAFTAAVIFVYFQFLVGTPLGQSLIILAFSLLGMAGSYGIAWFGIRVNTFANSRTTFASLRGRPYDLHHIPLRAGMSIGTVLISLELLILLLILLVLPGEIAGSCFIGFAIGESLGASALRIAGGIFTKIADIGSDLMKIAFKIKEDDARNPGVIADCTGDNAGDSVGPSADGFETYGVTSVALVTFIMLAVGGQMLGADAVPATQATLLVWLFTVSATMIGASLLSYAASSAITRAKHTHSDDIDFERPLTELVWITSGVSILATFAVSWLLIPDLGDGSLWWKLAAIMSCGTLAGALIPEVVKVFTSVKSKHVEEVVKSSQRGGASLNILSGLVAGNFSALWLGLSIVALMTGAYLLSMLGLDALMVAPGVFAFGLVAFGFLAMGPVTIAVDSYGPVTDNAQSIYELSTIEDLPGISDELEHDFGFTPDWERAKHLLELNDGAGNTFKATAKPVLIGTAVVGATTMIFSIMMLLTSGMTANIDKLSLLYAPFLLGLIMGGGVIHWFAGASIQAVTTGSFRAVGFIADNIQLDGVTKASEADSRRVVEICTQYAQKGMFNIFLGVFFATLAFAFTDPYFFIGYLVSIAIIGLYQAIFMANAGGAWDNAKKIVEVDLAAKGTPLHDASIVGDTVGDPYKDTSSVALNPVIKFTTLFGLLAVELGVSLRHSEAHTLVTVLAVASFIAALVFMWRSFYKMRIDAPMLTTADIDPVVDEPAT
ncbi:sodium-translocating pyrophosphatase [Propioniciclava sp. MC1595]|nr:sodium-translocating pyrophosphatase [Propioniciclava sp. MC1595]QTE27120.1 sodium-translocating pyrophosphatase [Propioniciclava sp. MC1595]